MPNPPKVSLLPEEIRAELDRRLVASGYGGLAALSEWLAERGYEISIATLCRHGQRLERQMSAIKASTEMAKAIVAAAPDEEDSRSAAVISLVQAGLFDAMVGLEEAKETSDPAERLRVLSRAATAIADVGRASVGQKRWAADVRGKIHAKFEALEKDAAAGKGGLNAETLRRVREEIYGIVA